MVYSPLGVKVVLSIKQCPCSDYRSPRWVNLEIAPIKYTDPYWQCTHWLYDRGKVESDLWKHEECT